MVNTRIRTSASSLSSYDRLTALPFPSNRSCHVKILGYHYGDLNAGKV